MIPTNMPFGFKRNQFPIHVEFLMTINKTQGQSLSFCGINLEKPCFSHGQIYAHVHVFVSNSLYLFVRLNKTKRKKNAIYQKRINPNVYIR